MRSTFHSILPTLPEAVIVAAGLLLSLLLAELMFAEDCPPENLYQEASCEELQRSGWPWSAWRWAQPQAACDYTGYYVGGGASRYQGRERCPAEGTWGWDYRGKWFARRVRLAWFCKPRRQGGEGQYQPDGPRVLEAIAEACPLGHEASE